MNPVPAATRLRVDPALLGDILSPYKPHCRYLKRATVETPVSGQPLAVATGEFEIPESWYIDETGHFNSIEFNVCYNQLVYVLIGQCVVSGLIPELADMTLEEYRRRQLPDVLIVKFSSTFRKAMDSRHFRGAVAIDRAAHRGRMLLLKTRCDFEDEDGGFSEGEITLAIVNQPPASRARAAGS